MKKFHTRFIQIYLCERPFITILLQILKSEIHASKQDVCNFDAAGFNRAYFYISLYTRNRRFLKSSLCLVVIKHTIFILIYLIYLFLNHFSFNLSYQLMYCILTNDARLFNIFCLQIKFPFFGRLPSDCVPVLTVSIVYINLDHYFLNKQQRQTLFIFITH